MSTARPILNLFNTVVKTAGARNMMAATYSTVSGIAQTPAQRNESLFQNVAKQTLNPPTATPVVGIPFSRKEVMTPKLR